MYHMSHPCVLSRAISGEGDRGATKHRSLVGSHHCWSWCSTCHSLPWHYAFIVGEIGGSCYKAESMGPELYWFLYWLSTMEVKG